MTLQFDDVTVKTIYVLTFQNSETAAMLVYQAKLWELKAFLMQTLSFVPKNFKHGKDTDQVSDNALYSVAEYIFFNLSQFDVKPLFDDRLR